MAQIPSFRIGFLPGHGLDLHHAGTNNGEETMAYTLDQFCADSHDILKSNPLADALPQVADRLSRLLSNPAFVAATFDESMPPGKRELHHDPELDFHVLAHVQE